jgi:hypothetical protein
MECPEAIQDGGILTDPPSYFYMKNGGFKRRNSGAGDAGYFKKI